MKKQTRLMLLILSLPVLLSLGYQYGAFDFVFAGGENSKESSSKKNQRNSEVDRILKEVKDEKLKEESKEGAKDSRGEEPLSSSGISSSLPESSMQMPMDFQEKRQGELGEQEKKTFDDQKLAMEIVEEPLPLELEGKGLSDSVLQRSYSWVPGVAPIHFKESPGLEGGVRYRIFYGDSSKLPELEKWEASLRVAIGNIFYLSARNQWNLPHLSRAIKEKFNGILPGDWVDSVAIIHIELNPGQHDQQNH